MPRRYQTIESLADALATHFAATPHAATPHDFWQWVSPAWDGPVRSGDFAQWAQSWVSTCEEYGTPKER